MPTYDPFRRSEEEQQQIVLLARETGVLEGITSDHELTVAVYRLGSHCKNIRFLSLLGPNCTDAAAQLIAKKFTSLEGLDLAGTAVTETGVIAVVENIPSLLALDLWGTWLTSLAVKAIMAKLKFLETLRLEGSTLTDEEIMMIADNLPRLKSLRLGGAKAVTDVGVTAIATRLTDLERLGIGGTKVTDAGVRVIVEQLKKLKRLSLGGTRVTEVGVRLVIESLPKLERLDLEVTRLVRLPEEVKRTSSVAIIRQFLYEAGVYGTRLHEVKLVVLGRGRHGKTLLTKWLAPLHDQERDKPFVDGNPSTDSFEMRRFDLHVEPPKRASLAVLTRVNLFDFGGQPEMYSSHRFFLSDQRNVYIVVLNALKDERENRLDYWLRMAKRYGNGAPVIIVVTHCDGHGDADGKSGTRVLPVFDGSKVTALREKYGLSLIDAVDGYSNVTGQNLDRVRAAINQAIAQLDQVFEVSYPSSLLQLKNHMEDVQTHNRLRNGIEQFKTFWHLNDTFRQACESVGQAHRNQQDLWLKLLRDLGVVHWVGDRPGAKRDILGGLHDLIYRPNWVKGPIYRLLMSRECSDGHGVMSWHRFVNFQKIHQGLSEEDCRRIMALMEACGLCFQITKPAGRDEPQYLVVDHVLNRPEGHHPQGQWRAAENAGQVKELEFDFLPDHALVQLLGRWYTRRDPSVQFWKDQLVLQDRVEQPDWRVLLSMDADTRRIKLWFEPQGQQSETGWHIFYGGLLQELLNVLELQLAADRDPEAADSPGWREVESPEKGVGELRPLNEAEQRLIREVKEKISPLYEKPEYKRFEHEFDLCMKTTFAKYQSSRGPTQKQAYAWAYAYWWTCLQANGILWPIPPNDECLGMAWKMSDKTLTKMSFEQQNKKLASMTKAYERAFRKVHGDEIAENRTRREELSIQMRDLNQTHLKSTAQ